VGDRTLVIQRLTDLIRVSEWAIQADEHPIGSIAHVFLASIAMLALASDFCSRNMSGMFVAFKPSAVAPAFHLGQHALAPHSLPCRPTRWRRRQAAVCLL
jgi:hypothetical protein